METGGALASLVAALVGASPELDEARALYQAMRYKHAAEKLWLARDQRGLTKAERREVHDLLARSLAAQGRLDESEAVWSDLLELDPEAPEPAGSAPKVMNAYQRAKAKLASRAPAPQEPPPPAPEAEPQVTAPEPEPTKVAEPAPAPPPTKVSLRPSSTDDVTPSRALRLDAPASRPQPMRWVGVGAIVTAVVLAVAAVGLAVGSAGESAAARDAAWAADAIAFDAAARDKAIAAQVVGVLSLLSVAGGSFVLWSWP